MNIIEEIEGYISGQFNSIKMLLSLITLEAKLAGLTIVPMLINLCMFFVILITFWLTAMTLFGYFLYTMTHNYYWAFGAVTLLNLMLCAALLKYLAYNIKAMSFEKTRHYFSSFSFKKNQ